VEIQDTADQFTKLSQKVKESVMRLGHMRAQAKGPEHILPVRGIGEVRR